MTISVRLHPFLSERIGSRGEIMVEGGNIQECLHAAAEQYPELDKIIWPDNEQVNAAILIFYQDEVIHGDHLNRAVMDGDQIDLIPAISGG